MRSPENGPRHGRRRASDVPRPSVAAAGRVVLVGRTRSRLTELRSTLIAALASTDSPSWSRIWRRSPLSPTRSIVSQRRRVAVLIDNAGAIFPDRRETGDGIERRSPRWSSAHSRWCRDCSTSCDGPGGRVIAVTSGGAQRLDLDDLQSRIGTYSGTRAYEARPVALVREWARRLGASEHERRAINAMHPGWADTRSGRGSAGFRPGDAARPAVAGRRDRYAPRRRPPGEARTGVVDCSWIGDRGPSIGRRSRDWPATGGVWGHRGRCGAGARSSARVIRVDPTVGRRRPDPCAGVRASDTSPAAADGAGDRRDGEQARAIAINTIVPGAKPADDDPRSVGIVSLGGSVPAALAVAVASTATTARSALSPTAGVAADPAAKTDTAILDGHIGERQGDGGLAASRISRSYVPPGRSR